MSKNSKLTKVLEYLIKNDEEKAKELLHQVFIEKARAIHEDMMSHDDEMEEDIGGSGDEGKDFRNAVNARGQDAHSEAVDAQIRAMENEIDFEETMNEDNLDEFKATTDDEDELALDVDGDEMDMDVSDDMPMDGGEDHEDHEAIMDKMSDLETALAELKAEFEKLEAEERGEGEDDETALENIVHEYNTYIAQEVMVGSIQPVPPQTIEQVRHQASAVLNHLTRAECHPMEETIDALKQTEPRMEPGGIKDPGPGWA